mmetsp:Transcript_17657/g.30436  ORF Transcript_17657/g.30436 Transcript_17657/m.30436 type:complete len:209 (+) Transcript_17657:120-746(+)
MNKLDDNEAECNKMMLLQSSCIMFFLSCVKISSNIQKCLFYSRSHQVVPMGQEDHAHVVSLTHSTIKLCTVGTTVHEKFTNPANAGSPMTIGVLQSPRAQCPIQESLFRTVEEGVRNSICPSFIGQTKFIPILEVTFGFIGIAQSSNTNHFDSILKGCCQLSGIHIHFHYFRDGLSDPSWWASYLSLGVSLLENGNIGTMVRVGNEEN